MSISTKIFQNQNQQIEHLILLTTLVPFTRVASDVSFPSFRFKILRIIIKSDRNYESNETSLATFPHQNEKKDENLFVVLRVGDVGDSGHV